MATRKGRAIFVFEVTWERTGNLKFGPAPALLMAAIESSVPGTKCTRWALPDMKPTGLPKPVAQVAIFCSDADCGWKGKAARGTRWPVSCGAEMCRSEAAPKSYLKATGRWRGRK